MTAVVETSDPRTGYAICSTMRSGSTWLAELLTSTGVLGRPSEYFSTRFQQERLLDASYPSLRRAQAAHILEAGRTPNGVYGFKMYPAYFNEVAQKIGWTATFPGLRYIHLRRRDILGQAISRVRAQQTRQWRSTFSALDTAHYNGDAIFETLQTMLIQDARWQMYFALNQIEPLPLVYEDMIPAPQATVDSIADLVDVSPRPVVDVDRVEIKVQRDAQTQEWRDRFLAAYGDQDWMVEL